MACKLEEGFKIPPKEFSPAAFWFWYGKLEKDELARQIDEMVEKGVYNAFMHPRAYLVTEYLEEEWWDIIDHVIHYSKEKDFHPWIYDEYAWPSGTAGSTFQYAKQKPSRVLAAGECNMAKGLRYESRDFEGPAELDMTAYADKENAVATVAMQLDQQGNIMEGSLTALDIQSGSSFPCNAGRFRIVAFYRYIIPTAVDYLNKKTIEAFIQCTHEAYRERYGEHFGERIPGIFFDEIFNAANRIVWTDGFEQEFVARKGYDIKAYLPLLIFDGGSLTPKVRKDYYDVLAGLYEDAFFKPIGKWCEENNLMLTGHTEEALSQHPLRQGDYFRTMRHLQIPGGDCHDYRYKYPRKITPVEPKGAVSVARLYGRERAMSEALGGGGWATSLQEFKRGIHVLAAMGINFFVLHGFSYELEHQGSQGDWPPSFFFQNPYWKNFKVFADYISRLSYMGTIGRPVCKVGLLYPIGLIQQRFRDGRVTEAGERISFLYNAILEHLLSRQMDTDIIDEDSICNATLLPGKLKAGAEEFEMMILPDAAGLDNKTVLKLQEFERQGGRILLYYCGEKAGIHERFEQAEILYSPEEELTTKVKQKIRPDFEIVRGDGSDIYYYHRILDGMDYFLIVNASDSVKTITVRFEAAGVPVLYNAETGLHRNMENILVMQDYYTQVDLALMEDEAYFVVFHKANDGFASKTDFCRGSEQTGKHTVGDTGECTGKALCGVVTGERVPDVIKLDKGWTILPVPQENGVKTGLTGAKAISDSVQANDTCADIGADAQSGVDAGIVIQIPVARFQSELDPRWSRIRIQNRKGEAGSCKRHISRWKAAWITRRPSWTDGSHERTLYFRKTLDVAGGVKAAKLCIAAVNRYTVYINGRKACEGEGWRTPAAFEVSSCFKTGENLIAVCVENDTPLKGQNLLEAETFDPDILTSLLLEGYIDTENDRIGLYSDDSWITCSAFHEGWETQKENAEQHATKIDVKSIQCPWGLEYPEKWIFAWERGKPPVLPWGRLPLFSGDVEFPVELQYEISIPAGTAKIFKPAIKGDYCLFLDNKPIDNGQWLGDVIRSGCPDQTHTFLITVKAHQFSDGLTEPVKVAMLPQETEPGDWRKLGVPFYSGSMEYKNTFILQEKDRAHKVELDLGQVHFHAEVRVNGKPAGVRLWKPYKLDITDLVQTGENHLSIIVSNLAANEMRYSLLDEAKALGWNRYWYEDNIDRDAQNLESGLLGPVLIRRS